MRLSLSFRPLDDRGDQNPRDSQCDEILRALIVLTNMTRPPDIGRPNTGYCLSAPPVPPPAPAPMTQRQGLAGLLKSKAPERAPQPVSKSPAAPAANRILNLQRTAPPALHPAKRSRPSLETDAGAVRMPETDALYKQMHAAAEVSICTTRTILDADASLLRSV